MEKTELPELPAPKKIRLGYSKIHFRGVFATEDIEAGELIERCPTVTMAWRTNYQKDPTVWAYMYTNSCPCEECKRHGAHFIMVMGWGQIYNHQDDNNASIKINTKDNLADIVANRKIKKGEEIFVSYGEKYFKDRQKITIQPEPAKPEPEKIEYTSGAPNPMDCNVIRPL